MSLRFQPENFQPENAVPFSRLPHEPKLIDPEEYDASEQQFAASLVRQANVQQADVQQADVHQSNGQQSSFESGFPPDVEQESQFASGRPLSHARFIASDPMDTNPLDTDPAGSASGNTDPAKADSPEKDTPKISSQPAIQPVTAKASPIPSSPEDSHDWRNEDWRSEVSARVSSYRNRRPRAPRYPSLQLKFESSEPRWNHYRSTETSPPAVRPSGEPQNEAQHEPQKQAAVEAASQMHHEPAHQEAAQQEHQSGEHASHAQLFTASIAYIPDVPPVLESANNLLEFPRPMLPPSRPADELAEPVQDCLRIIEAPEITPPPPALGGILIESEEEPVSDRRRPGFEVPLQSSSLSRRIAAATVDATTVLAAAALFGYIFVKLAAPEPQWRELAATACGIAALFWAGYQYLALVYTGTTLGLRFTRLQLVRFNGKPAPRRLRRWRFLASLLSAVSLALGYFWCFLDEDRLCWHDRITRTHMSPRNQQ